MTTYAQLDKYGKESFIPRLQSLGFAHHKTFCFSRVAANGMHHIMVSQILSSKERFRLWPHIWVPELGAGAEKPYPQGLRIVAEFPSWKYQDWRSAWEAQDEARVRTSLDAILRQLESNVIPWFDSIRTGKQLVAEIPSELAQRDWMLALIPAITAKY